MVLENDVMVRYELWRGDNLLFRLFNLADLVDELFALYRVDAFYDAWQVASYTTHKSSGVLLWAIRRDLNQGYTVIWQTITNEPTPAQSGEPVTKGE